MQIYFIKTNSMFIFNQSNFEEIKVIPIIYSINNTNNMYFK
jgi:hypothetical protein